MRHLRILGLCVAAIFAMSATTLVVASPALAGGCNEQCQKEKQEAKERKEKEKQEAKERKEKEKEEARLKKERERRQKQEEKEERAIFGWEKMDQCPVNYPPNNPEYGETGACIYGEAGPNSYFQAGKVTVHFAKPVVLRGGFEENEVTGALEWIGALNGETISKEAEPAPSLTEGVNAELLTEPEKARYEAYLAGGGSTKVTATIELAAPASSIYLNEGNLLEETEEAFGFPVEIHLNNKFLGKTCYVGSYTDPIVVPFTTGETSPPPPNTPIHGKVGELRTNDEGTILQVGNHTKPTLLVNNSYAAPGVSGCGVQSGADAAIDAGLGLPSPAGSNTTVLDGSLYQSSANEALEHWHFDARRK